MEEVLHEIDLKSLRKTGDNVLGEIYEVCPFTRKLKEQVRDPEPKQVSPLTPSDKSDLMC
jgi:hypothetical protein